MPKGYAGMDSGLLLGKGEQRIAHAEIML
jgi:hypothetical protein